MADPVEEAQSMAHALDTRSVYTRIGNTSFVPWLNIRKSEHFSFNL